MKKVKLGDVLQYEQPSKYIVENTNYNDKYKTPVLTAGKTFLLGYTNEKNGIYEDAPCIIFDDFTTATKYVDFPFKVKSSAMKILNKMSEDINLKYYFYLLQVIDVDNQTHKRYWISEYSKLYVFLPPLEEQEKIVLKIEELLSKLDNGIDELNKAKDKLAVYRQAVLKSAFIGELSINHNKNKVKKLNFINNANDLRLPSIPKNWNYIYLSELGELGRGKSKHRPRNDEKLFEDGKYPFIQTGEVKSSGNYITDYKVMYGECGLSQSKLWSKGTLCITIAANIAETCFLGIEACFPDSIVGFTANEEIVLKEYVKYFIESSKVRLWAFAPATAQKNINLKTLENLIIPICGIEEQKEIVNEIESRLSICDNIENVINESLGKSESLRQSILKKAFDGKLV